MRKTLLILTLGLFFLVQAGEVCWSQTTVRVSVDSSGGDSNGASTSPSISSDGRYVAFESDADDLVALDNNASRDIFVHDRDADGDGIYDEAGAISTLRVSIDSGGAEGSDHSSSPSISGDGMHVAFVSDANDLVTGDINPLSDIFVHELGGTTNLVSVDSAGAQDPLPSSSSSPSISSNGRYVAFQSDANLVVDDTNGRDDIFVRDLLAATTTRVSVRSDGTEADLNSSAPSISSDGRYVAFDSFATDLLGVGNDTNGRVDIFVHDRDADGDGIYDDEDGTYDPGEVSTVRVSVDSNGAEAILGDSSSCSISSNGRYVAFESFATNLVANDTNGWSDIFVHDRDADGDGIYDDEDGTYDPGEVSTVRVSVDSNGIQGNGDSNFPSISSDGRYVAFMSDASNLVDNDTNGSTDIFVHDRDADGNGTYDEPGPGSVSTVRVSVNSAGDEGNGDSSAPSISGDGMHVAFESDANDLVASDNNPLSDIFVYGQDPPPPNTTQSEENNSSANISCFIATAASDWVDF